MKKNIFILFLALSSSIIMISCSNPTPSGSAVELKSAEKEVYTCPMHAEVQIEKPGECPKCGMPLEKKETADSIQMHNQADTLSMK
jgi:hypothetical protein